MNKEIIMQQFRGIYTAVFLTFSFLFFGFSQTSSPFFKNGDVICFLGDSITHGGQYHEFLQLFYATRYPNLKLTFHNCGISGDNAAGMIDRFEEDVMKHKPTHVFLMTGMNDVQRTLYFEGTASKKILKQRANALDAYERNTTQLAEKIIAYGVTPIFLTPSIYDQYSKIEQENNLGCNDALIECSHHLKKLGNKYDALVIDLNMPMRKLMERELKKDSLFTIIGKDRVHPRTTGHFIMFHEIISRLEKPGIISKIAIDLSQNEPINSSLNTTIEELHISENALFFNVTEKCLTFPVSDQVQSGLSLTLFEEKYNWHMLQVDGLEKANYDLIIEDEYINSFSHHELEKGVNLANYENSPQNIQAKALQKIIADYRKTSFQLRIIPFIKYKYLQNYNGQDDLAEKRMYLNNQLKVIEQKPYHGYIKSSMEAYFETLPKIDSLEKRKRQLSEQIHSMYTPRMQQWKLIKGPSPRI
ncbi:MAG: SGNH/GDSL hydrolase family protein [Bacteroidetes bacterium]|nr:SGNH/GDSL hydrolase family protein [Bacteroidota bacterium]